MKKLNEKTDYNYTDELINEYSNDIYNYETLEEKKEYVNWLKSIGAWEDLTDVAKAEVLN